MPVGFFFYILSWPQPPPYITLAGFSEKSDELASAHPPAPIRRNELQCDRGLEFLFSG